MRQNKNAFLTTIQKYVVLATIFLAPSNLFLKLLPHSGYVHGLQIDYLIPKLFLTDVLMLSSIFLEVIKNWMPIKHRILKACTQCVHNLQLITHNSQPTTHNLILSTDYLLLATFLLRQFFTPFPVLAFWTIAKFLIFITFFLLVKNSRAISRKFVINTFLFSLFFQAIWGMGQFFLQHSLTPYWLVGETQLHGQPYLARADFSWLDALIGTNFGIRVLSYGLTPHPNILAGFLALGTVILVTKNKTQDRRTARNVKSEIRKKMVNDRWSMVFALTSLQKNHNNITTHLSRRRREQPNNSPLTTINLLLPTSYLLLTITTLFLTQSLSAWLAVGMFVLITTLIRHIHVHNNLPVPKKAGTTQQPNNSQLTTHNFLISIAYSLAPIAFLLLPFTFYLLPSSLPGTDHLSISRRIELNQAAWNMFVQHPILGVGFNQITAFVEDFSTSKEVVNFVQPAHHVGLLFLAEHGIVGMILLLFFSLFMYKKFSTHNSQLTTYLSLLPFAFFLLPLLTLDHYLYTLNQGWWMILILGILLTKND